MNENLKSVFYLFVVTTVIELYKKKEAVYVL